MYLKNLDKETNMPRIPNQPKKDDWQPKDWIEKMGKKMHIRQQDIKLFKMSVMQSMMGK